ncbi:MAG TPA: GIY-YIG nuclease [Rhodospirillaceae bacterium]|nr:GIY-YIG nuclease [Alphaproteobacteria bacterium]OUT41046.1 MAG: hypothetical protein CBB62_01385 [Micavibrio sp. TMED2]HCI48079.1 GIY-YIG nuclease [Rhodospirillaceae bacterium]MAS47457.1 GIY-YIG nuclease [Alphaproteobacteria bacterium]MAX96671.1 GIY-YIG nuclease [Alphaproteobacteria bacterium]|tara:strand:- start:7099 stop:7389 length:291 start_codon:yes stop_codon:yes gene_type:complete
MKRFWVYLLASKPNGVIYTGMTSDLAQRIHQHKTGEIAGFTARYNVKNLVYAEEHATAEAAITREKQVKAWKRDWKIQLIETDNPEWRDLYETYFS